MDRVVGEGSVGPLYHTAPDYESLKTKVAGHGEIFHFCIRPFSYRFVNLRLSAFKFMPRACNYNVVITSHCHSCDVCFFARKC